jgi:hypothetical protein
MAMNTHAQFEELLPLYAASQLQGEERGKIENHLSSCQQCQDELRLWKAVAVEIDIADRSLNAPPALANQALERIHKRSGLALALQHAWQLLRTQALLVQSEMWPASAMVMAMGVIVAMVSDKAGVIFFLAPLVAASTLALLYGPENDPALELSLSTPTSPWKILLARLSVVSGYNLLLTLAATLMLLYIIPPGMLGAIILGWLGPLTFLSALALLLSIWLSTSSAIAIAYSLWLLQYIPFRALGPWINSTAWAPIITAYQQFWHNPWLLLPLAMLVTGLALWSANRTTSRLTRLPG